MRLQSKWDNLFEALQKDPSLRKSRLKRRLFSKGRLFAVFLAAALIFYGLFIKNSPSSDCIQEKEATYENCNK